MPNTDLLHLNPIPVDLENRKNGLVCWPFGSMDIGSCYSVGDPREHDNAACSYKYHAKKRGFKYKRKTVGETLLIWRTE